MNNKMENTTKQKTTPETQTTEPVCPLKVAKWAHSVGLVEEEQVDAMESFTKGEMDYGEMRSRCG